ncbi:MAG: dUTP diphosphatase, partial [Pseudomonadota bacterium]|nr:dUTP diphosphatase [Pseudomonadota bacterium]
MARHVSIEIKRLPHSESLPLPSYETEQAAGMDLRAALQEDNSMTIAPGKTAMVPTGLSMALPQGFEAQIR